MQAPGGFFWAQGRARVGRGCGCAGVAGPQGSALWQGQVDRAASWGSTFPGLHELCLLCCTPQLPGEGLGTAAPCAPTSQDSEWSASHTPLLIVLVPSWRPFLWNPIWNEFWAGFLPWVYLLAHQTPRWPSPCSSILCQNSRGHVSPLQVVPLTPLLMLGETHHPPREPTSLSPSVDWREGPGRC